MKIYEEDRRTSQTSETNSTDINLVTNTTGAVILLSSDRSLASNFSIIVIRETNEKLEDFAV